MSTRTDRLLLMLRLTDMPEVDNLLTWQVDHRAPTSDEVRLLHGLTKADALDIKALLELWRELTEAGDVEERGGES